MAVLEIHPVQTVTSGGFNAVITGIDPANTDCIVGVVDTPGQGSINVRWNLGGLCRDTDGSCNLDMRKNETADVRETAKRLGASW